MRQDAAQWRRLAPLALALPLVLTALRAASAQAAPPIPITVGPVTINGYVQLDYLGALEDEAEEPETDGTFYVRRARLAIGGELGPRVSWYLQGDFANAANDTILRDAYVTVTTSDALAVRFGQYAVPYSLERITSTSRLEIIDRSSLGTLLTPSRDFGLLVFNPKPFWGWLSYSASIINGTGENRLDNNDAKDLVGRLVARVPSVPGLSLAVNATTGAQPSGDRTRAGFDAAYDRGPFRLVVETLAQTNDLETRREASGYYVLGVWRHPATKPTSLYAGYELAARFVDVEDDAVVATSKTLQVGGNYYLTPQVRIMNNLVLPIGDDQPRTRTRWWSRVQVVF